MSVRETFDRLLAYREANPKADDHDLIIFAELELGVTETDENLEIADSWIRSVSLPGDPETIILHDRELYCGVRQDVLDRIDAEYCKKRNYVKCRACGSYETILGGLQDCSTCDCLVDGSPKKDSRAMLLERFDVVHDHDELLLVAKERLPTHETPANHSWVFLRFNYYDPTIRGEFKYRYHACLSVVNVGMAGKAGWAEAARSCGVELDAKLKPIQKAVVLLDYGTSAHMGDFTGNCEHQVTEQAMGGLTEVMTMGGHMLDGTHNALGATGWDCLAGDRLAGVKRYQNRLTTADEVINGSMTLGEFLAKRRMTP